MSQKEENPEIQENKKKVEQPTEKQLNDKFPRPHVCSICRSPNHFACGCEAKHGRSGDNISRLYQELTRDEDLEKILEIPRELIPVFYKIAEEAGVQIKQVYDDALEIKVLLQTIAENTAKLLELETNRADLLKDIQNAC